MRYLLAVLVLVGCGKGVQTAVPGIEFHDFDAHTEGMLRKTADDLFERIGGLRRHVDVYAVHNGTSGTTEGGRACVNCPNCWIEINVDRDDQSELEGAFWHEYGHCSGLRHTAEHGVMYPTNYGSSSWWPQDIADFVAAVQREQAPR